MRRATVLVSLCLALAGSQAQAHAFLDHASPRVGSTIAKSPDQVTLWFSEPLERAFSWVKVSDASGKQVDRGDKAVDTARAPAMHVSIPPLAPGKYRVTWRAVSVDTHVTEGEFSFEVKP